MLKGAVAVGPEAGEWLQQLTLAIRAETPIEVLLDVIQPYPTFSEGVFLALRELNLDLLSELGQPLAGERARPPSEPSRSSAAAPTNHDEISRVRLPLRDARAERLVDRLDLRRRSRRVRLAAGLAAIAASVTGSGRTGKRRPPLPYRRRR